MKLQFIFEPVRRARVAEICNSTTAWFVFCILWLVVAVPGSLQAAAVPYYFDVDGANPGFGTPSGIISQNSNCWNTSSGGEQPTVAFSAGNIMVFGWNTWDLQGATFTFNLDGAQMSTDGITVNSTNVNITFQGGANLYLGNDQTWSIAKGSVFNEASTWNGGMNFDGTAVQLTGGGTLNFVTAIGANSGSRITENDAGAGLTVNLYAGRNPTIGSSGGFTLTSGNLNIANVAATNTFGTGSVIFNGGKLDNTSGSPMTLTDMSGYVFGGNFMFGGSSSLSLGMSNVALAANSMITVISNTLTISGSITGSYSLAKAGAGVLDLEGTNSYTGVTTVSNGTLLVNGSLTSAVTVASGAMLGGTGVLNGAVLVQPGGVLNPAGTNTLGTLTASTNVSILGTLKVDVNRAGQCDLLVTTNTLDISAATLNVNVLDQASGHDYVIARYTTLAGAKFASVLNLPGQYAIEYNYNSTKSIAIVVLRGTVMIVK